MDTWVVCNTLSRVQILILNFTAMLPGGTIQEVTQLNIESLWSGGPFQDPVRVAVCEPSRAWNVFGPNVLTI